jgi:peptide/nickel transport system substrate-binding protein
MSIVDKPTRLRLRRLLRRRQQQVEAVTTEAENKLDSNFFNRLDRLMNVKRFVTGWLVLVVVLPVLVVVQTVGLNQYYLRPGPVAGGMYTEGVVGSLANVNPIYAAGPADLTVSRLVFASLFYYRGTQLVGDVAAGYQLDDTGKTYTVRLKPNVQWHDGKPLTSDDVVFTYKTIQNPDAGSPFRSSWQGVTVTAPDKLTVVFRLPNALTAFPHSLTTGIIPRHVLGSIAPTKLRGHEFNTSRPVGAGPLSWDTLQLGSVASPGGATALVSLKAFPQYHAGAPRLEGFTLQTYEDQEHMIAAYQKRSILAMSGLKTVPDLVRNDASSVVHRSTVSAARMLFFKTTTPLLKESAVRRALVLGTDRKAIISSLGSHNRPVRQPFLIGQTPYDKTYDQPNYNPEAASTALDQAGWVRGADGMRSKDKQPLTIPVVAEDTAENHTVLQAIESTWKPLGVRLQPQYQQAAELQSIVETHGYTAVLYGMAIGQDPDVFAYWHSSQADMRSNNRLNFSEYNSRVADEALESGRTRLDTAVRTVKYKAFLKAWQEDAPAIALYQPQTLYVTRGDVYGLDQGRLNTDIDRYTTVATWSIITGNIPKN